MSTTRILQQNVEYLSGVFLTNTMQQLYMEATNRKHGCDLPTFFIFGEHGTGKELLAKSLHYSRSPQAPFFTINCVNLPFDHFREKIDACISLLQAAGCVLDRQGQGWKATLFLRDIERLKTNVQENLFELLKQKLTDMTSGPQTSSADNVQVMFSSSRNEGLLSADTRFVEQHPAREFNPCLLSIKPLRERIDDIKPLSTFFIDRFSKEYDKDIGGIHSSALHLLEKYNWPFNVSELKDVIENAVLLSQGPLITKDDVRFHISKKSIALESFLSREDFFTLDELEHVYIQTVLRRVKKNKSKAARILGISRNTLQRRLDALTAAPQKTKSRKKSAAQPTLF